MAKKNISPLMTWVFWGILVLGVFLLVMKEFVIEGFSKDSSNISYLIVAFFLYGFFASLKVAFYLQSEFKALERMDASQRIANPNASDAAALLDSAMERIRQGDRIDMKNLITAYGAKIKAKVDNVSVISSMLVTIGLLGTVVGLIITVTGLGQVLASSGSDYAAMKIGLNKTVSGMGTAFYTTLFGALLGGVVLKVLGAEMRKSATQLVAHALQFSELFLAPKISQSSSETIVALEERVAGIGRHLDQLGVSFSSIIDTIDSKQVGLATGLGDLVSTVERSVASTNDQADERVGALINIVDGAIRQSDERTTALVALIEQANRQADERIEALIGVSKATIEDTSRTAEERLRSLAESMGQIVGETHSKADERLEALIRAIDMATTETHRLADERLGALLGSVERAADDTQRKADERLVELVDTVGHSIDHSRKEAEKQLSSKASDLAQKLTAAANVLATLSESPAGQPQTPEEEDCA